jgi:hypothetical protein
MSVTAGCYDIELPCAPGELGILRACNEILTEQPVEFCAPSAHFGPRILGQKRDSQQNH